MTGMSETKDCCGDCKFLNRHHAGSVTLTCRRYPPNSLGNFPVVAAQDWCGEFQHQEIGHTHRGDVG